MHSYQIKRSKKETLIFNALKMKKKAKFKGLKFETAQNYLKKLNLV